MQYVVFAPGDSSIPALLSGHTVNVTDTVSKESLAMMIAADCVLIDARAGTSAWYVYGLLHGLRKRAVMVEKELTRDALAVAIHDATVPFADVARSVVAPLSGVLDDAALDAAVRGHLERRGIVRESDLARLDFEDLAADVPRPALHRFVRELARSGRYPDPAKLQEFLIRRGIFI